MGGSLAKELEKARDEQASELSFIRKSIKKVPPNVGELEHLTRLNVSYNSISKLPPEVAGLRNLKYLNMVKNRLKELPQEMTQIDTLEELNLSINKIVELPRGFGSYNHLRFLDLSFNCLTELSPQIGLLSTLIELHISFNKLKSLPAEIVLRSLPLREKTRADAGAVTRHLDGRCANLEIIKMGNNFVTKLPNELGQLEKLRSLDVSKNKLKLLPPDLGELHEVLVEFSTSLNPFIKELDLNARKGREKLLEYLRSEEYDKLYYSKMGEEKDSGKLSEKDTKY